MSLFEKLDRWPRRVVMRWMLVACLVLAAVAAVGFDTLQVASLTGGLSRQVRKDHALALQVQKVVQVSRYDGAYRSCEQTNLRHANAVAITKHLTGEASVLTSELIGVLAPLRNGQNGRETCTQYASIQTALNVPQAFEPHTTTGGSR